MRSRNSSIPNGTGRTGQPNVEHGQAANGHNSDTLRPSSPSDLGSVIAGLAMLQFKDPILDSLR